MNGVSCVATIKHDFFIYREREVFGDYIGDLGLSLVLAGAIFGDARESLMSLKVL